MNGILWIVGVIVFVLLLPVFAIWYIRVSKPHSKKMANEQAQLDRKTGATGDAVASTSANGKGLIQELKKKLKGEFSSRIWTILLVVIGAAVFFWGLYTPGLRLWQVGDWSWDHWISLPAFCGIVFALIKMHKDALGTMAKPFESTLGLVVFSLFIGIPAVIWVRDAFLPQVICRDLSSREPRSCVLNTAWSSWIKAEEGPAVDGMRVCSTPGGKSERIVVNGTSFFRYKADEGTLIKMYRLFPGDKKCPATM